MAQREKKGASGGNDSATGDLGPRDREREREHAGKKTGANRLAPAGRERDRERTRERGTTTDRRGPPVRQRRRVGARPSWAELGWFGLCWSLVLKCYELRTRQHKMLKVKALRPSKHYLP
jgi:hypothetical protein